MDFRVLCDRFHAYTEVMRGFSRMTVRRNRNALSLFAKQSGISDHTEVTSDLVRNWIFMGRTERNWGAATCRTYHKSLKVFFDWGMRERYFSANPALDIELPRIPRRIPKKLNRQEAFRLLEIVYNYPYAHKFDRIRNHAVMATFLFAGLRKEELLRLKYAEVDLGNLSLVVRKGKGNKDRVVPITSTLADILRAYLKERQRLVKTCPEFFVSRRENVAMSDTGLRLLIGKLRVSSGISFSPHTLRHTFATLMLEGGCDVYSLSKMMGHSDISTTTIYLTATVEHLRGQVAKHPLNVDMHSASIGIAS